MRDEGDLRAIDGLLRELSRTEDASLRRILERTRPSRRGVVLRILAASILLAAAGLVFARLWSGRAPIDIVSGEVRTEAGRLVTGPDHSAELRLADQSRVVMRENTALIVGPDGSVRLERGG